MGRETGWWSQHRRVPAAAMAAGSCGSGASGVLWVEALGETEGGGRRHGWEDLSRRAVLGLSPHVSATAQPPFARPDPARPNGSPSPSASPPSRSNRSFLAVPGASSRAERVASGARTIHNAHTTAAYLNPITLGSDLTFPACLYSVLLTRASSHHTAARCSRAEFPTTATAMGGSHSREDLDLSSSDEEEEHDEDYDARSPTISEPAASAGQREDDLLRAATPSSLEALDAKLRSLDLKYQRPSAAKLYLHVGGASPSARWVPAERRATYAFVDKAGDAGDDASSSSSSPRWFLEVRPGPQVSALVGPALQLKTIPAQSRADFVAGGSVWALRLPTDAEFRRFWEEYERCLFENTYGVEATDDGRKEVFGADFAAWARPGEADDAVWADAEDSLTPPVTVPARDLLEEFEEEAGDGGSIQSLALGALDNSFLVGGAGIQVVKNFRHGVHGKGVSVRISGGRGGSGSAYSTPKKALLMRGETNMLLMSPGEAGKEHSNGVHHVDIETGKVVAEWRFEKDGTDITMRDIANDSKGAQLEPSGSTFLGLDDNRLCRWDMRDARGRVQTIGSSSDSPVLQWSQGHQFSRGTNFQCFASTGDGSVVVGSVDGKIRLYSKSSMRMAKTVFPGLGSPITHVDVTYDGKWILGTTDTYLILICTIFKDKDGKEKTGFSGRMGNRIAAPRLLKLTPLDSILAGTDNKLHGGQFSWVTENGKQEKHLVATVGKFSVVWNFQQVKDSNHDCYRDQQGLKSCYCYKVVLKDESIVDSRFMHEKFASSDSPEAPLVVATPMKVSSFSIAYRR